jgi:flagellar L-ring protein precursor FlgH
MPRKNAPMIHPKTSALLRLATALLMATSLSACGSTFNRLSHVGEEPAVSPVRNPAELYPPVTMPMPAPVPVAQGANSLWRAGSRAFLKDGRASQVGDIVRVTVSTVESASTTNDTRLQRIGNSDTAKIPNLLGYQNIWGKLPGAQAVIDPTVNLLDATSDKNQEGKGTVTRNETITMNIAAVVTQVLPNGNLVIGGSQEFRVNFETRILQIAGVIRPSDIDSSNSITHERIAEARIIYGGRGQITELQQPRWGSQILDVLFPF